MRVEIQVAAAYPVDDPFPVTDPMLGVFARVETNAPLCECHLIRSTMQQLGVGDQSVQVKNNCTDHIQDRINFTQLSTCFHLDRRSETNGNLAQKRTRLC